MTTHQETTGSTASTGATKTEYGHICFNTNSGKCTFRPYPTLLCSLCRNDGINVIYDSEDELRISELIKSLA